MSKLSREKARLLSDKYLNQLIEIDKKVLALSRKRELISIKRDYILRYRQQIGG